MRFALCLVAASLVLVAGCSQVPMPTQDRLDEAAQLVWTQTYKMHVSPPTIRIVPGVCVSGLDGTCADGSFDGYNYAITIAWGGKQSIADAALAHELYHARFWVRDGDPDARHLSLGWRFMPGDGENLLRENGY